MKFKIKSKKKLVIIAVFLLVTPFFCIWQNNSIVISEYSYTNGNIPISFDGFKILQVSDLHNKQFGQEQSDIIRKIKEISPDLIVITGDLIDRRHYDLDVAINFVRQAIEVAPIDYVSGNHEAWSGQYDDIKNRLLNEGVAVLDNEAITHGIGQETIEIVGVKDPAFLTSNYLDGINTSEMETCLSDSVNDREFEILLSHRPELMELYKQYNVDIVFSGHGHGGQIRLPFIGGIVVPNQGLFPKYDAGRYDEDSTTMFVSRGLGNSIFPIRIANRPELVVVTLKKS